MELLSNTIGRFTLEGHITQLETTCWPLTVVVGHRAFEHFPFYHFDTREQGFKLQFTIILIPYHSRQCLLVVLTDI